MFLGAMNYMRVVKKVDFGVYLDGEELGEILLPKRYAPKDGAPGDLLEVFLYRDSEDRLIATTRRPYAMVDECAYLKVVDVNSAGAFLDWGLEKDLFVPFSEQNGRMKPGHFYVVNLYLDEETDRIAATARLDGWLSEDGVYFKPGQKVDLLIYGQTDLGYKAVVNHTHLGLIFKDEALQPLRYGQRLQGYIKNIRQDRKIDLSLQPPPKETRDVLMGQILDYLQQHDGICLLTDKSKPEEIYKEFGVSKASFKKALGRLFKQKQILLQKDKISLPPDKNA